MPNKETLLAEAKKKNVEVPEEATKAEIQASLDKHDKSQEGSEEETPAEVAAEDVEKSGVEGITEGENENGGDGSEPDASSDGSNDEDQTVPAQADGIDGVERDHTPAGTTEEANAETDAADRIQPPVAANGLSSEASDEAYEANTQVNPAANAVEVKESENEDNAEKVQTRLDEAKEVDTELGSSEEEAAAARAGVSDERLESPKQNREPQNEFEQSNQKVTEEERQTAQEVSDMTTKNRTEEAPTPNEAVRTDAGRTAETNQGSEIAIAIAQGFKQSKDDSFALQAEPGVDHRFSLVKNKQTGEVMIRENETGTLSKIQLLSLEEKEADVQKSEVEEL
ncbi:hypothetical protein BH23PAT2_BH23PAT2_08160 [soil metagenome]